MRNRKSLLFVVACLMAVSALVLGPQAFASGKGEGAGTSYKPGQKFLVGLSIRGLDNPYYIELIQGVKKFVEHTPGAEMVIMEFHGDDQKEINDVKAFAARGIPSILYMDPRVPGSVCASCTGVR